MGILLKELEQPVLVFGKLKKIVLFGDPLRGLFVGWTKPIDEIFVCIKGFAPFAKVTFILSFLDIALIKCLLNQSFDHTFMIWIRRADKSIVGDSHLGKYSLNVGCHFIAVSLGAQALALSLLLDLRSMFVHAGGKEHVAPKGL